MATLTQTNIIISTNPATGRPIGEVRINVPAEAESILARARKAQAEWAGLGLKGRLAIMRALKTVLHRHAEQIVDVLVAEQGKARFEAYTELWPTIELLDYSVRIAERTLSPERVLVSLLPHRVHWVERRPYGVILVITPWNFPLILSMTPIISALIAGNSVVYKPSEYSTQMGELIMRLLAEAGVPHDVVQIAHGAGDLGAALINAKPNKIVFTGSTANGKKIAMAAGQHLIPVTLELGGKDAAIVLEDADLDRTAEGLVWAGMFNAGQMCVSIERIYVRREVADQLVEKMAKVMQDHLRVGPGDQIENSIGAITTPAQMEIISRHIREAVEHGARVVVGGRAVEDSSGRFYLPTLLTDVTPEMRVMKDETFGPVLVVVPVASDEEAISLANNTSFGLTGSVWTRNRDRGLALGRRMRVGHAGLNDHVISASAPNLPWGGVGDSGYGRTRGKEGLIDMTFAQVVSAERFAPLPREVFWYPYTPLKITLIRRAIKFMYAPTLRDRLHALFSNL